MGWLADHMNVCLHAGQIKISSRYFTILTISLMSSEVLPKDKFNAIIKSIQNEETSRTSKCFWLDSNTVD